MRLAPCGHQNNRTCISKFTEARSEPLNASRHCNNITNTFKLISSYYHLRRSRLAVKKPIELASASSPRLAHASPLGRIASFAIMLQIVSTYYSLCIRASRSHNISNLHQQVHQGARCEPLDANVSRPLQLHCK